MRRARIPILMLLALAPATLFAQSELVIHKEGTNLYHRPGCPQIKRGDKVLAMTRGQAELRGYKPHPQCDPSQQPASRPPRAGVPPPPSAPVTVYVDGSKYYHRKDCRNLSSSKRTIEAKPLEVAGKAYWPCPVCKPPVRRKASEPAVPGTGRRGG